MMKNPHTSNCHKNSITSHPLDHENLYQRKEQMNFRHYPP